MKSYWAILSKDLRTELRTRETLVTAVVFSLLVLVVFNFSFELRGADLITLAPGVLWATFIFNGILSLGRSLATERENVTIEALRLAPVDSGVIFLAKWTLSLMLMLVTELFVLISFGAIFDVNVVSSLLLLDILLGTAGFAAIGTSLSVVAFNSRARDVMLPVLLLPLSVPIIIGAVRVTALELTAAPTSEALPWLNLIGGFDVLFLVVCYYSFGILVEDS